MLARASRLDCSQRVLFLYLLPSSKYPAASYHTMCFFFADGNILCSVRKGFSCVIPKDQASYYPGIQLEMSALGSIYEPGLPNMHSS